MLFIDFCSQTSPEKSPDSKRSMLPDSKRSMLIVDFCSPTSPENPPDSKKHMALSIVKCPFFKNKSQKYELLPIRSGNLDFSGDVWYKKKVWSSAGPKTPPDWEIGRGGCANSPCVLYFLYFFGFFIISMFSWILACFYYHCVSRRQNKWK